MVAKTEQSFGRVWVALPLAPDNVVTAFLSITHRMLHRAHSIVFAFFFFFPRSFFLQSLGFGLLYRSDLLVSLRDEGSGDGLAQGVWALACSGFGELADEPCCFFAPTASCFNSKNDQAAATWMDRFWARPLFRPSHNIPLQIRCFQKQVVHGQRQTSVPLLQNICLFGFGAHRRAVGACAA